MRKILIIYVLIIPLFMLSLFSLGDSSHFDQNKYDNISKFTFSTVKNRAYAQIASEDSTTGREKPKSDHNTPELTAHVIYQTRGRVYLDKGINNGVNDRCCVKIATDDKDTTCIPLDWYGIDLCSFTIPPTDFQAIEIGAEFNIRYVSNQNEFPARPADSAVDSGLHQFKTKPFKVTIAYPTMPSWPHAGARDHYDREFSSLISSPLNRFIEMKPILTAENQNGIQIKVNPGRLFSNADTVSLSDIIYSIQYCFDNPSPETYNLTYLEEPNDVSMKLSGDEILILSKISPDRMISIISSDNIPLFHPPVEFDRQMANLFLDSVFTLSSFTFDSLPEPDYTITAAPYYIDSITDDEILLVRNEYHQISEVYPHSIVIRIISDYLKRKLAFQVGELDFLDLHQSDFGRFKGSYRIETSNLNEAAYLTVNNRKDYLMDGILTTSLSYLINKNSLCRVALGKSAVPLNSLSSSLSDIKTNMYEYNPSKGRSLLQNLSDIPRYLSLLVSPDDFLSKRTAEYIKGILERENIYTTIYSDIDNNKNSEADFFSQYDLMLGRIDLAQDDPVYILNQICFNENLDDNSLNRSLYLSDNCESYIRMYYKQSDSNMSILTRYYSILTEIPSGIILYTPKRSVVIGKRINKFGFNPCGLIDFKQIEIADETER